MDSNLRTNFPLPTLSMGLKPFVVLVIAAFNILLVFSPTADESYTNTGVGSVLLLPSSGSVALAAILGNDADTHQWPQVTD